jgi:histidine triad (HIT) family protein
MANGQMTPEQAKALQEKLKNMSPEELKEFQKKQCIFCQLISGRVASKKVYEDEICTGILDINPANPGHILLMPKEHYQIMPMVPEEEIKHLGMVSKALSHALLKALKIAGTNIFIANGIAAGQRAQHFMLHVIPRKEGDGIGMVIPEKQISEAELAAVRKDVRERISEIFKLKKETVEAAEEKPKKEEAVKAELEEKEEKKAEEKKEEEEKGEIATEEEEHEKKEIEKPVKKKKKVKKEKPEKEKEKAEAEEEEKESEIGLDEIARLFQ